MRLNKEIKKQRLIVSTLYDRARRDPGPLYRSRWYSLLLTEYNKLDRLLARDARAKAFSSRFPARRPGRRGSRK